MSKRIQFHRSNQTYKASGIIYHCDFCGKTYTQKFVHGTAMLPLDSKAIELQKELHCQYGKVDTFMHRDGCVCKNCLPQIENYERALDRTKTYLEMADLVADFHKKEYVILEDINDILDPIIDLIMNNFSSYVDIDKILAKHKMPSLEQTNDEEREILVEECIDAVHPHLYTEIQKTNIPEFLQKRTKLFDEYEKKFIAFKNKKWNDFVGGEQLFLLQCDPSTCINLKDYVFKTCDYDREAIAVDQKNTNFRVMSMMDISLINFDKIEFGFDEIVDTILTEEIYELLFCI